MRGDGDADGGDLAADGALEGRVAVACVLGGGVDVGGDGEGGVGAPGGGDGLSELVDLVVEDEGDELELAWAGKG